MYIDRGNSTLFLLLDEVESAVLVDETFAASMKLIRYTSLYQEISSINVHGLPHFLFRTGKC